MSNKRVPVLAPDGTPLMPTKASRARRWLKNGLASIVQNDLQIFVIQLEREPSGYQTQEIACGIDPGSDFTGVAIQSKYETLQGLNLNLPRKQVSKRMVDRAVLRRTRRGRRIKRSLAFKQRNHRSKRFDNRRQSKLPPSIRANKQLELRAVKELLGIYPITHFYVEKLTRSDSPGFTRAAQGQTFLIDQLLALGLQRYRYKLDEHLFTPPAVGLDINAYVGSSNLYGFISRQVVLVEGWETSITRQHLGLTKSKNKAEQSPDAHANDAVAMASRLFIRYAPNTIDTQTGYLWKGFVQITSFDFASVQRLPSRPRKMHDLTVQKGGKRDAYGGHDGTHSYRNGDIVQYKTKRSCFTGIISANDLYEFFPKKKRLKQGITDVSSKLIKRSCNLLVNRKLTGTKVEPLRCGGSPRCSKWRPESCFLPTL